MGRRWVLCTEFLVDGKLLLFAHFEEEVDEIMPDLHVKTEDNDDAFKWAFFESAGLQDHVCSISLWWFSTTGIQ